MSNKLTELDLCKAAKRLRTGVAEIRAVDEVESRGGGFDSQGRVKILFERHKFWAYAPRSKRNEWRRLYPNICNPQSGGYGKSSAQYGRFSQAFELDPKAAMLSCSWGRYQIMGFNYAICGYRNIDAFVDAMKTGEGAQLLAFCEFVEVNHLGDEIRGHRWADFARGYNGAAYRINKYDTKLASAYSKFKKENIDCDTIIADATNSALPIPAEKSAKKLPINTTIDLEESKPEEMAEPNESEETKTKIEQETPGGKITVETETKDKFDAYIPQIDSAKKWLKWVGGGTIFANVGAWNLSVPYELKILMGVLLVLIVAGGLWMFIKYSDKVFEYVTKMNSQKSGEPVLQGSPPKEIKL